MLPKTINSKSNVVNIHTLKCTLDIFSSLLKEKWKDNVHLEKEDDSDFIRKLFKSLVTN